MKALVIGGTGPSGPYIVNGLLKRGYDVAVLHGGQHEVGFERAVEHIHTDPHFAETLNPALEGRRFDLTIATYGRIRIVAETMKGKTDRLLTVSGGAYAPSNDPRWGPLGSTSSLTETSVVQDNPDGPRFSYLIWLTEQTVLQGHHDGHYESAVFRYPTIYGKWAPANRDWSVVRRLLDDRKQLILGDGGHALMARADGENAAHALLLAVDRPRESAGQTYNVGEESIYSERQRVEHIIRLMGRDCEIVDMPSELARKASPTLSVVTSRIHDIHKIQADLGYRDVVSPADALKREVDWLVENRPEPGGEQERQLADPFDYEAEDALIRIYREGLTRAREVVFPVMDSGHMYRHPKKPGEAWSPRSVTGGGS